MIKREEVLDGFEYDVYPDVKVGQRVQINAKSPHFVGALASVAYIESDGISVFLLDSDIDECVWLNIGEWDIVDMMDECCGYKE